MSDETKEKRQESIGSRFSGNKSDKASSEEQPSKTDKETQTEQTDKTYSGDKADRPSTKDKTALTMYLRPETIKDEDLRFQELNLEYQHEYDAKLQKNADYWPAVFEAAHSDQTVREVLGLGRDTA